MANDGQRVSKRTYIKDMATATQANPQMYVLGIKEDTLPSHRFPCTNEIAHKNTTKRVSYRINNRMFLCVDTEHTEHPENTHDTQDTEATSYMYIKYNHSPQVDLKKMQSDVERTIRMCTNRYHA